ncbi:GNAT family N-acetyltransferase [Marinobacter panjinensis]|uniref:GNAT family N-acetyltransferase n=1 Tax=Marinobacter panjinensis TaxID=2576384 RepID=A0A4U6R1W7_9GAMM|nr:GNAT family N-acetyltransferase [Marinobacter panjinensis]MCR8914022.1 GNAT family N-acetyltransferase [Marinobacter panjinensis]TKV67351.1 GNAT family N-acetyltransferase [Marinobacter panjinensis]
MNVRIRKYSWQLAPADIRTIRQAVFVEEQRVPPELEWDDTDEIADHYLVVLPDNTPVGVGRLFSTLEETAHIGRMAILPGHRGKGIGETLLRHLVSEAASQFSELQLSAQEHAIPFYQRSGFHVCSDFYDDAGIPHVDMRCLAPQLVSGAFDTRQTPMLLGEDHDAWLFDSESTMTGLMDSVIGQARQRIWLYDRLLDHDLYDRLRFRELISTLARRHRLSEVRLLIHDDKPLVKHRHQIVELMRRLPSRIELRLVNEDYPVEDRPFLLADREGVVFRHDFYRPEGFANFADSGRVRLLAESFQRMWDAGKRSLELRELPL